MIPAVVLAAGASRRMGRPKALLQLSGRTFILAIVVVAAVAVPLALPTFFEIPLALILLASGAPLGAAVALLIAGPSVNLPSLFTIMRSTNWKVAGVVALSIWILAVAAGILVSVI